MCPSLRFYLVCVINSDSDCTLGIFRLALYMYKNVNIYIYIFNTLNKIILVNVQV